MAIKNQDLESQTTEFKPNWQDEYLRTICAFTNTEDVKGMGWANWEIEAKRIFGEIDDNCFLTRHLRRYKFK